MPNQSKKTKKKTLPIVYVLGVLHLFIGLNATVSGLLFLLKPDGAWVGMQPGWLERTPFESYFIPGLLLLILLGIPSLIVFYGLFMPPSKWSSVKLHRTTHWAWIASLLEGLLVILWIIIQVILTHYFWMQPVIIVIGMLIVIFSLNASVINFYSKKFE